jgi:fibronectin type 3 domain-containing protein
MVIRLLSQFYIWELMFDRIVDRVEAVRYILRFDWLSSVNTSWKFLVDVFYVKQTE